MAATDKRLGKHGVLVSNNCLGTMNYGWQIGGLRPFFYEGRDPLLVV